MLILEAINNVFITWYTSFNCAITQALLMIQPLISEIDLDKKTGFKLSDILTVLGAGLAFLAVPEVAGSVSAITGIVTTALQQAPIVAKGMLPSVES